MGTRQDDLKPERLFMLNDKTAPLLHNTLDSLSEIKASRLYYPIQGGAA